MRVNKFNNNNENLYFRLLGITLYDLQFSIFVLKSFSLKNIFGRF